ncbi:hypothetical protein HY992_02235 [Candidatus Micrarchaeota archaeon]|nr:hypothetical protein [Candidatus Micrarchaeota archaeon]
MTDVIVIAPLLERLDHLNVRLTSLMLDDGSEVSVLRILTHEGVKLRCIGKTMRRNGFILGLAPCSRKQRKKIEEQLDGMYFTPLTSRGPPSCEAERIEKILAGVTARAYVARLKKESGRSGEFNLAEVRNAFSPQGRGKYALAQGGTPQQAGAKQKIILHLKAIRRA